MDSLHNAIRELAPIIKRADVILGRDISRAGFTTVFYGYDKVKRLKAKPGKNMLRALVIRYDQTRIRRFDRTFKPLSDQNPLELEMVLSLRKGGKGEHPTICPIPIAPLLPKWFKHW